MSSLAELVNRITDYMANGGAWNPEEMEHDKVRDLLMDCRAALTQQTERETAHVMPLEPRTFMETAEHVKKVTMPVYDPERETALIELAIHMGVVYAQTIYGFTGSPKRPTAATVKKAYDCKRGDGRDASEADYPTPADVLKRYKEGRNAPK